MITQSLSCPRLTQRHFSSYSGKCHGSESLSLSEMLQMFSVWSKCVCSTGCTFPFLRVNKSESLPRATQKVPKQDDVCSTYTLEDIKGLVLRGQEHLSLLRGQAASSSLCSSSYYRTGNCSIS